ncbi:unnamed protein product [Cyprideis torosa]|uniref:Uncharacterized protein n=1 Tax=Cyprideis torosa TaxID=163714 RepID=A0A7R8ZSV6_9CRUS|nr:unnamed protein product [Cyprideis torosa]CAG0896940.1 unnamed protein product [Cyprideis torosa]
MVEKSGFLSSVYKGKLVLLKTSDTTHEEVEEDLNVFIKIVPDDEQFLDLLKLLRFDLNEVQFYGQLLPDLHQFVKSKISKSSQLQIPIPEPIFAEADFERPESGDCWNNNFLFESGEDSEVALVDWQWPTFTNGLGDLALLMYTSTGKSVRDLHTEEVLKEYLHMWNNCLDILQVPATKERTLEDIKANFDRDFPRVCLKLVFLSLAFSNLDKMVDSEACEKKPGPIMRRYMESMRQLAEDGIVEKKIEELLSKT